MSRAISRCDRRKCFAHARDRGALSLLLYDVTTLYFETDTGDGFREPGSPITPRLRLCRGRGGCGGVRAAQRAWRGGPRGITLAARAVVCLSGGALVGLSGGETHGPGMHRRCPRRHGFGEWCARRVREWLDRQRGLAPITIDNYCWNVEQFLTALPQPTQVSVSLLDAGTVTAFMVEYCRDRNTNSVKSMARSVRSFLRFAHATGRTSVGLWGAVPVSAGWHLASLPRSVPAADLERLLAVAGAVAVHGHRPPRLRDLAAVGSTRASARRGRRSSPRRHRLAGWGTHRHRQGRAGLNACLCRPGREKRSPRGWSMGGLSVRRGRCSPRSDRPVGRCRLERSAISSAAHAGPPG